MKNFFDRYFSKSLPTIKKSSLVINRGFLAFGAVFIVIVMTINFLFVHTASLISFADIINKKELRTQAKLNAESCLNTTITMLTRDYFLNGDLVIKEFGCNVKIDNNFNGFINLKILSKLSGVSFILSQSVGLNDRELIRVVE